VPSDIESDTAHLLLVRYVVTKGLSDVQGRKMAQTMIRNSVFFGGSGEVRDAQKFMECLSQARENPRGYCWNCEDIWSCKRLRERPACTGWNCEYYQARPIKEPNYERSEDQASMEEDILTYLLNDPDSVTEALRLGLRSEGFADEYVSRGGIRSLLIACCGTRVTISPITTDRYDAAQSLASSREALRCART
jgi:hypothetical protein